MVFQDLIKKNGQLLNARRCGTDAFTEVVVASCGSVNKAYLTNTTHPLHFQGVPSLLERFLNWDES